MDIPITFHHQQCYLGMQIFDCLSALVWSLFTKELIIGSNKVFGHSSLILRVNFRCTPTEPSWILENLIQATEAGTPEWTNCIVEL
jgi:hypothetical protein